MPQTNWLLTNNTYINYHISPVVNGIDYSLLNALSTGNVVAFNGHASLTVRLNAGKNNTIRLVGGHGDVNIDYITTNPLD